jgi:hypothetical protein
MFNHLSILSSSNRNQINREISNDSISFIFTGFSTLYNETFSQARKPLFFLPCNFLKPNFWLTRAMRGDYLFSGFRGWHKLLIAAMYFRFQMIYVNSENYRSDKIIANELSVNDDNDPVDSSSITYAGKPRSFSRKQKNRQTIFTLGESRKKISSLYESHSFSSI